MPTKKKRAFTKNNSTKYVLLHGHATAQNADGESLAPEWVKVDSSYKPGASLLMGKLAMLGGEAIAPEQALPHSTSSTQPKHEIEPDLNAILEQFEDASDSEDGDIFSSMKNELKHIQFTDNVKKLNQDDFIVEEEYEEDGDEWEDDDESDTSDADISSLMKKIGRKSEEFENDDFFSTRDSSDNITLAERKIEKKFEEYEDEQIGPLEDEEIFGYLTGKNEHVDYYLGKRNQPDEEIELEKCDEVLKEKILKYSEEEHVEKLIEIVTKHAPEFDCQSIISTYSNKYNHPSIIKEEGKIRKIKIPNNPLQKQLTKSMLKQLEPVSESDECSDEDNMSVATTVNLRPRGETPEQRQERKKLFKQLKSENRKLKKENKIAFKNEKRVQRAQIINAQNNKGIRLF